MGARTIQSWYRTARAVFVEHRIASSFGAVMAFLGGVAAVVAWAFPSAEPGKSILAVWWPYLLAGLMAAVLLALVIAWLEGGHARHRRDLRMGLVTVHSTGRALRQRIFEGDDERDIGSWLEEHEAWLDQGELLISALYDKARGVAFAANMPVTAVMLSGLRGTRDRNERTALILRMDAYLERLRRVMEQGPPEG